MGLLPSTAVSLYLVFLCYQTVRANPSAACAPLHFTTEEKQQEQSGVITNTLVAAFTITWTSWRTSATSTSFSGRLLLKSILKMLEMKMTRNSRVSG